MLFRKVPQVISGFQQHRNYTYFRLYIRLQEPNRIICGSLSLMPLSLIQYILRHETVYVFAVTPLSQMKQNTKQRFDGKHQRCASMSHRSMAKVHWLIGRLVAGGTILVLCAFRACCTNTG